MSAEMDPHGASQYTIPATLLALCLVYVTFVRSRLKGEKQLPGPPGLPIIGNTLQVPTERLGHYFMELGKKYGPVMKLSLGGDDVIVLNRMSDANELLVKRAAIYSSRPPLVYAGKYQSQDRRFVLFPYNNILKRYRQAFHQMTQSHVPGSYDAIQDLESLECVYRIGKDPLSAFKNANRYGGALIYHLTYGKRLQSNDQELTNILYILDNFAKEVLPGAHVVDAIPLLDRLPDSLAPWRRKALNAHEYEMKIFARLVNEVKTEMNSDNPNTECFSARAWESKEKLGLDDKGIAYLAGIAFEAGTGTIIGTILWSFTAALLFPEKFKVARDEIDRVVGKEGAVIPNLDHFQSLRYCYALIKEVLRWQPPVPTGVPHYLDKDDVYNDYVLKKGSIVIGNIYAMHHNEEDFPNPYNFDPMRFMPEEDLKLSSETFLDGFFAFGFGRRICAGRRIAPTSVWLAIVRILWAFDISPVPDDQGKPFLPTDLKKCTSGLTSEPEEFPLKLTPRSEAHLKTINELWSHSRAA